MFSYGNLTRRRVGHLFSDVFQMSLFSFAPATPWVISKCNKEDWPSPRAFIDSFIKAAIDCKYLSNITKFCFKAPISQISQLQHDVRQCCIDRPTIEFRLFGAKINNLLNPASVATAVLLVMVLILCLLHILCVFHWPVLKAFVCNVFILGSFGLALLPAETARSPDHFKSKL